MFDANWLLFIIASIAVIATPTAGGSREPEGQQEPEGHKPKPEGQVLLYSI